MYKYLYKVIIDWRGTSIEEYHDGGVDTRFFGDIQQAKAFKIGFKNGNECFRSGIRPVPDLRIEPIEDNLHWENHFGFYKDVEGSQEATEELKSAISKFQIEYHKIKDKYKDIGMGDTDSDESISSYIRSAIH
tara:strand:+ start:3146 stop:3544 length:399 start_codon:yes stop_codon:yes gene_type:complete